MFFVNRRTLRRAEIARLGCPALRLR